MRASKPAGYEEALEMARSGEAYGYRAAQMSNDRDGGQLSSMAISNNAAAQPGMAAMQEEMMAMQQQMAQLTSAVAKMCTIHQNLEQHQPMTREISDATYNNRPYNDGPYNNTRVCYRCQCPGHLQAVCNFQGWGKGRADMQCTVCHQVGHGRPRCKQFQGN